MRRFIEDIGLSRNTRESYDPHAPNEVATKQQIYIKEQSFKRTGWLVINKVENQGNKKEENKIG